MANFGHLKKLTHLTVKYDLPDLGWGACALLVESMSERNKAWLDHVLKRRATAKPGDKADDTPESRDAERRADIDVMANHVIRGWSNIIDAEGKSIDFSVAACVDFLNALCDFAPDVLDRLRLFCLNSANFTPTLHVETLVKNS